MNRLVQSLAGLYYAATLPGRRRAAQLRAAAGREPITVLFYHRVADTHLNPWTMPRREFRRQMDWLCAHCDVVSLAEAQRRIIAGTNRRATACITFDDGYADNSDFALPLLAQLGLPYTYFVTTGNVLSGEPFPHDVQAGTPLRPNTLAQLRRVVREGGEVGAHARRHVDLGRDLPDPELLDETAGAKRDLEGALGVEARYFAFPFGLRANLSARAFTAARRAGYAGVCSAYGAYNWPGDDPFHIQRVHADPEFVRFKNWLTVDPRKVHVPRYCPAAAPPDEAEGVA